MKDETGPTGRDLNHRGTEGSEHRGEREERIEGGGRSAAAVQGRWRSATSQRGERGQEIQRSGAEDAEVRRDWGERVKDEEVNGHGACLCGDTGHSGGGEGRDAVGVRGHGKLEFR
jgi:hypothetical protein